MCKVKAFKLVVKHDAGRVILWLRAYTQESAINTVMQSEGCPRGAIVSVTRVVSLPSEKRK